MTLEALPHVPLPQGSFKTWCGRKDRFLLDVNGQLEAYAAGVTSATIAVSSEWPMRCSNDGQQLVYVDTRLGYVTKVDIGSGATRFLASYDVPQIGSAEPSFSADLQSVATNRPLRLTADAGNLKTILVRDSSAVDALNVVDHIKWSDDSSKLFAVYSGAIEVLDAFLKFDSDELGPDLIIKCSIASWKCDRLRSRIDSVSLGGRGILGTIGPLGKPGIPYNDVVVTYPRYAAELRYPSSKLLARQVLLTASGRDTFGISVSPTGTKAILTWDAKPTAECRPPRPQASYCNQGMIVDLSKLLK